MRRSLLVPLLFCGLTNPAMAIDLTALRDFSNPALSEQRFQQALSQASGDDALILHTQIARTHGLRKDLDTAQQVLKRIEGAIATAGPEARVRYHLDRTDEALEIQLRLEQEGDAAGQPDPYVFEELEALYRARGDTAQAERYRVRRQAASKA